jgi:glycosyltransferase involved in cell wall biosynthesis
MINVLHLRDTDRVCGPGKTIIETACATDRREFNQSVGLYMRDRADDNLYRDAALARGVEVIPIESAHPYDPRIIQTLLRLVRERDVHVLHSHEYKSDMLAYAVARLRPLPIVTTIHGWITHSLKRRWVIGLSQRLLPRFDRVIAVSQETRRRILACGVSPDRVVTIHNGIVVGRYQRRDHPAGFVRRHFGLPADAIVIANIGRLSPEKGSFDFLEAAAVVTHRHAKAYFVFVGDGPDRSALEARAAALGLRDRVLFTGFMTDVRPVYADTQILALTSHTEGFPNVVMEALCMDVPVLATDVGGTGELVRNDENGVLVPAHRPEAIADGLCRLLGDPSWAAELALAGKRAVYRDFAFELRVRREEDLYRDLLQGQHLSRHSGYRASAAV